jgi:RNA polymerase sigma-70 factor (ECF subfamily)
MSVCPNQEADTDSRDPTHQKGARMATEAIPPGEPKFTETTQVVDCFEDLVYRIALAHTSCAPDADDVYQNVFLTYHRKRPLCRDQEHIKAWLINTTLKCALQSTTNSWRARVIPITPEHLPAESDESDQFTFQTALQQAVFAALTSLAETYRTPLYLFYFEDLPVNRIAELLDLEPGTVKTRLSRGRTMMRELLQGDVFDE